MTTNNNLNTSHLLYFVKKRFIDFERRKIIRAYCPTGHRDQEENYRAVLPQTQLITHNAAVDLRIRFWVCFKERITDTNEVITKSPCGLHMPILRQRPPYREFVGIAGTPQVLGRLNIPSSMDLSGARNPPGVSCQDSV